MQKKSILLVDDEKIIRKTISKELRAEGYDVATAGSGESAIALLQKKHFDLVITDLMMEGLDGMQVLKHTKKIAPHVPVIILTGFGDMTSAINALRLGADDYMLKPCEVDELLIRMSRCFEKQDLLKQLKMRNQELFDEITARKETEEALKRSSEKIKNFAYSVSHDLKSPAIGINGLIRRLHKNFCNNLPEKGKNYCDQILKSSEQILALIESINTYMSAKEATLTIEVIKLKDIVRMIREEFDTRLNERQIKLHIQEQLPEIMADKLSILRVFRNLVDNALKYGGDDLSKIEIGYKESPEFHTVFVKDNGIGMDTKDTNKIFGLFQRRKTSRGIDGTGLGLAIVKEIAKRHGGEVKVVSCDGNGARLDISIAKDLELSC